MLLYYDPRFEQHLPGPGHPERPQRLRASVEALQAAGTWQSSVRPPCPEVEVEDLRRVHRPELLVAVRQAAAAAERNGLAWLDPDTSMSPGSLQAAMRAAGAAVDATRRVLAGEDRRALCLVRPPGHHATPTRPMGFCLFNNVAVAAAWAVEAGGATRVAIVDFDVHHGNGTQDAFWERGEVFYLSTHRSPFYPGTGRPEQEGAGAGLGTTLNLPLPAGTPPERFLEVFRAGLREVRAFAPELVLVSAGFDAWEGDPVGGLNLPTEVYGQITRDLVEVAEGSATGRIVSVLEGGYDLDGLGACLVAHARVLADDRDGGDVVS